MRRGLLIIDDDINILKALRRELSFLNPDVYRIYLAQSGADALELLNHKNVQVIISDQRMPNMAGTELLSQIKMLYPYTVRIILSAYADFTTVQEALNRGEIYKFLNKPWKREELMMHIRDAFNYYDIQKQQADASQVVNHLLESVMVTDSKSNVQSVNTAFCLSTEYEFQEVVGSYVDLFDRAQVSTEEIVDIYDTVSTQGVWQGDVWFRKKSGTPYLVFLSVTAIRDVNGTIGRYLYSFLEHTSG
jgi:PAS domain S-box-containing protein